MVARLSRGGARTAADLFDAKIKHDRAFLLLFKIAFDQENEIRALKTAVNALQAAAGVPETIAAENQVTVQQLKDFLKQQFAE